MPVPFIPMPSGAKTQMFFTLDGQQVVWVLNFLRSAPWTPAERTAHNTIMHGWWTNQLKALFTIGIALERIVTTNLDASNSPQTTEIVSPPETGTIATGSTLPNNVAVVVTHRTALRGRNFRGRTYTAGHSTNNEVTPGTTSVTFITNLTNAFFALIGLMNAVSTLWVVLSKFLNGLPRGQGVANTITAVSADQFYDSQRRRLIGRGV